MSSPTRASGGMWLLAAVLMLVEFLVFDRATSRHHAHVYPRWTDQTQYLTEAYTAFRAAEAHGLGAGLATAVHKESMQGTLHDIGAVLLFQLTGSPSRSAALSLNLLALLAWQAALLFVLPRVSGSRALAWMGFGLVLCLRAPWTDGPGSAVDFRLDHAAMCLLGVASALALLTDGFRSTRWSLAFGAAAGVCLMERFLTGVYFAGIMAAAAVWIATGDARGQRWRNLLLAGGVITVLAGPVFWANQTSIYEYYWLGHMASSDANARAASFDLLHSAGQLAAGLGGYQLGAWFGGSVAIVSALLLVGLRLAPRATPAATPNRAWLFFALAFATVPAAVLCLHRQKSDYVLGAIVPGIILLVLWGWAWVRARLDVTTADGRRLAVLAPVVAVLAGFGLFLQRELTPPFTAQFSADADKVNQVTDYLVATSQRAGLTGPRIGIDGLVDYFDGRTLSVRGYERHRSWLPFATEFPTGILEEKDEVIMARLGECDFVIVTDEMVGAGFYPYDRQMRRLYPAVKAWCDTHLRLVDRFSIFDRRMSLYQRRELP